MKRKAAICISGHFRNIARETFYKNFVNNLYSDFDVDIFISTWRETDNNDTPGFIEGKLKVNTVKSISVDEINGFYNPTRLVITDYNKVRSLFLYKNFLDYTPAHSDRLHYVINDVLIAAPQLYGIEQAVSLKRDYEMENNFQYDLVFRVRPDFDFCHPFDVEITDDLIVPIIYREPAADGTQRIYALDDRFAYSSSQTMDHYSDAFYNIPHLLKSWNSEEFPYNCDEENLQHLSCERILHRYFHKLEIPFRENGIKLVRTKIV